MPREAEAVIDAIDAVAAKAAMVVLCRRPGEWPVIVCGAAGGRRDPLRLRWEDLGPTTGDSLLSSLRARLRRDHGFTGSWFGIDAIHGIAPLAMPVLPAGRPAGRGAPLACAGYGSLVTVTATMGLAAAQRTIDTVTAA